MSEYPEHDKLAKVKEQSQAIGEFLDLSRYTLCEYREPPPDEARWIDPDTGRAASMADLGSVENLNWFPPGHYPVAGSIQDILAEWFGIDRDKLEAEKRAMLDAIRS